MNQTSPCHLLQLILLLIKLTGVYGKRIIGGVEVSPNSIKYQASLQLRNYHLCGGTLIHPQWVVSAAHCWGPAYLLKVILSQHDLTTAAGYEQEFRVTLVIRHSQYHPWTFNNDIMLLKLDRPAIINSKVEPASLPNPDSPPLDSSTECTVSGWGVTWFNSYQLSPVLRSVSVDIFPNCWRYYYFRVTNNMVCAGSASGGKDSCQGDSGGPLICNGQLEGIVSWGYGCAIAHYPGVYTRVRNYVDWINRVISQN